MASTSKPRIRVGLIDPSACAVRRVGLIIRIHIPILHEEVMQGTIDFVFPDVVGKGVHDLAALLIPHIWFPLNQRERRLVTDFTGTAAQVRIKEVPEHLSHVVQVRIFRCITM